MRRKWKAVFCVIGCCGSLMMNAQANDIERDIGGLMQKNEIMAPYYINISDVRVSTRINNGNAVSKFRILAYSKRKISVQLRLERYRNGYWNTVKIWSVSKSDTTNLDFSKSCSVSKGYTYRTVAVINCGGEQVTKYSNVVSY